MLGCKEPLTESMTMVLVMCKSKHGFEVSINFLVSEFWYIDMLKLSFKRIFWWIAKNLNKNIRRTERISFCTTKCTWKTNTVFPLIVSSLKKFPPVNSSNYSIYEVKKCHKAETTWKFPHFTLSKKQKLFEEIWYMKI